MELRNFQKNCIINFNFNLFLFLFLLLSDGYSQCVPPKNKNETIQVAAEIEVINPQDQLSQVCQTFSPSWPLELILDDQNCTNDNPGACPKHALCCQGQCYATIGTKDVFQWPEFRCPGKL